MTVEYVLLLICIFAIGLKFMTSAPADAFRNSGPRMGARIEKHLATGAEFKPQGQKLRWQSDR